MQRLVAITGAGSGIGRAAALALEGAGYGLALLDRDAGRLAETAALCRVPAASTAVCDVSDAAVVAGAFDGITAACGPVDILINSAGIARYAPFTELTGGGFSPST